MIPRLIEKPLIRRLLSANKIILLLGARQTGKTTLLKDIQQKLEKKFGHCLYLNCDLDEDKKIIDTNSLTQLKKLLGEIGGLFIDETQKLTNPGLVLKIIYDNFPNVKVFATGSSSFELKNRLSDAMTGRYFDFLLYPFSLSEIIKEPFRADYFLDEVLRFGQYPEVFLAKKTADKISLLQKIVESYLFKDIFSFQRIRHSEIIQNLTKALAYQLGSEINENELANRLKIDRKTVVAYLDILEQAFVIKRLFPFSKNPRREIGKRCKVYFYDLGIRNALIGDFNELNVRADIGALWENFLFLERLKKLSFEERLADCYFWRTYSGAEIDYLEKSKVANKIEAFEFKYLDKSLSRGTKSFFNSYKTSVQLINRQNYKSFIF